MSLHSHSQIWLHLVWGTLRREGMFVPEVAARVRDFLIRYARTKRIGVAECFVNSDHVHVLLQLQTGQTVEEIVQLMKGASSHWVNEGRLVMGRFAWGRGYGVFSVSPGSVERVREYIRNQAAHHQGQAFDEMYAALMVRYGVSGGEAVETASLKSASGGPALKRGVPKAAAATNAGTDAGSHVRKCEVSIDLRTPSARSKRQGVAAR